MVFSERLAALISERGTTWKEVQEQLGIGKNQQRYWEERNNAPDGKTLVKLCEYFGVTSDFLLGLDTLKEKAMVVLDDPSLELSSDEKWFILRLRELDKDGRTMVESTLVSEKRRMESEKSGNSHVG